jgi:putative transposase
MSVSQERAESAADTFAPPGLRPSLGAMARMLRTLLPDGYFHVYTRGVAGTDVFRDDEDRRFFLALLANATRRYAWELHAMCLMTTHYHVVLESTRAQLSAGMQWLNGLYAQTFNRRYGRYGHLFADRFGSRVIEGEDYLAKVCEYVLLNPVQAGLCERAAEWRWNATRHDFPD